MMVVALIIWSEPFRLIVTAGAPTTVVPGSVIDLITTALAPTATSSAIVTAPTMAAPGPI